MKRIRFFSSIVFLMGLVIFLWGCEKENQESSRSVLQKLARISPERAQTLALKKAAGKVQSQELELENGFLVYSFDIQTPDNRTMEVQINAKDGSLVMQKEETRQAEKMEQKEERESGIHGSIGEEKQKDKVSGQNGKEKVVTEQKGEEESESETRAAELQETESQEKSAESHIVGSIPVQKNTELNTLAKISEQQARQAALKLVEGKVEKIRLENEDGYLVYVVEIRFKGDEYEVLIDAGNGKVLSIEAD